MNFERPNLKCRSKDDAEIQKKRILQRRRSFSLPIRSHQSNHLANSIFRPLNYHATNSQNKLNLNGFYAVIISNPGLYQFYEGLFQNGRRFGPGVLTNLNTMTQNVGWWRNKQILRLCKIINHNWIPSLSICNANESNSSTSHKSTDKLRSNMAAIFEISRPKKSNNNSNHLNDCASFDLETILLQEKSNILIKKCGPRRRQTLDNFDIYHVLANKEIIPELLQFTSLHLDEETSYNISSFANNSRGDFTSPGTYEKACCEFLNSCCNGDKTFLHRLIESYDINVNLCDGHGNFGVMYAAARDKIQLIMELARQGADLNLRNDEGLTVLPMVLLRFIALLRNVNSWSAAFSCMESSKLAKNENFATKTSNAQNTMNFSEITFFYHDKNLLCLEERLKMSIEQVYTFYGLHLPAPGLQNFQKVYTHVKAKDSCVFDFRLRKDLIYRNKKHLDKCNSRKIDNETFARLTVIFNTLTILLHYGCDPNTGHHPLPPLFLGLFTENKDVIKMLLKFGADPSTRLQNYHNFTILHALASMWPRKYLIEIAKVLLTTETHPNDLDLDARTDGNHWWEERHWVIGNAREFLDNGKTPLHIVAIRKDFNSCDTYIYMKQFVELLISKGASCAKKYLGHVPLTLAMMRGNIELVKTFLKNGASPNEMLGGKMGTSLTIFGVNRFKNQLPPFETCKSIMQLLFQNGGDPLQNVSNCANALEFLATEKYRVKRCVQKLRKTKQPNMRYTGLSGLRQQIKLILLKNARRRMMRHYECLMFMALYLAVKKGVKTLHEVGFHLKLSRLMNFKRSLKIAQYLIFYNVLNPTIPEDFGAMYNLFEFISKHGVNAKLNQRKAFKNVTDLSALTPLELKKNAPELDTDYDKYKVCFTCCLKTGKKLLVCPSCGLVHFCCQRCESYSRRHKLHPCKIRFYRDELAQHKFCLKHEIHYEGVHDEVFNNIRILLLNLLKSKE